MYSFNILFAKMCFIILLQINIYHFVIGIKADQKNPKEEQKRERHKTERGSMGSGVGSIWGIKSSSSADF